MTGSWVISVAGQTYGPYDTNQMQAFAAEGRLARQSRVARIGETTFRSAIDEPELAGIFSPAQPARETVVVQTLRHETPASFGRGDEQTRSVERSHFVIIADMKSGSIAKIEETIATLGQTYPILPQVWLLASGETVNTVRNLLIRHLGKLDALFVVDAGNDRAAWFNFGPEADARIRKIWRPEPKLQAAS
ncbi:MAG TPA: DUF4339 domain-containing protein [Rhizomicrobium sp.]